MRKVISINGNWNFYKGDIEVPRAVSKSAVYIQCKTERKHIGPAAYHYFDRNDCYYSGKEMRNIGWQVVNLPHDYIVDQNNDKTQSASNGYMKYENAWYRKSVELNEEECRDKRILLQFDGIATQSIIYVNGSLVKRNFSAYNGFEIDITNYAYFDKPNIIAVYVNTDEYEGWWYQGGGIYRDARIVITDKTAIDRYGVYVPYSKKENGEWEISFQTTVINTEFTNQEVCAVSCLLDKEGNTVATASAKAQVSAKAKETLNSFATVKDPHLWSAEAPYLYTVKTTLYKNGEAVDENELKTGFRTIEATADGLFINGEKTFIYGVNGHQDFSLTGLVMPKSVAYYRARLLKEMGANGYRTSHYEQTACILDAMDELGLYVLNENRWFVTSDENYEYLEDLIKRDRNRPSVIFWSTGNEEITHISPLGGQMNRDMIEFIRKLDNTRPITACEDKIPTESKVFGDCDVIAVNYNLASFDKIREQHPDKAFFITESCATGTTRDWLLPTNNNGRIKDEDKSVDINSWYQGREKTWKHLMERPYVAGSFQWAGFEYRGEAMWPRICSVSGAIDFYLQKKGAFYQNKSHWTKAPMVHIVEHWNFQGFEGKNIPLTIYTNCDEIELTLNGKALGKRQIAKYEKCNWDVPFECGTLIATGYRNGEAVCSCERVTTGKPMGLKLTKMNDYQPDGRDVVLFTCECVDEKGLAVPNACPVVNFSSNEYCTILGTGSDHCDHIHISSNERKMYMGKITVALKPQWHAKEVCLIAEAEGLNTAAFEEKFEF